MSHPNDLVRPWCVVCGRPATNLHHEPPKGLGVIGKKGIEPPVLSLCGSGTTGCHGMRHAGILKLKNERGKWYWQRNNGYWHQCLQVSEEWWDV